MTCGLITIYWVKCKQSNSHTSLTTLCSYFLLSHVILAMAKSAHGWSWSVICMGNFFVFLARKYSRRQHRYRQKFIFFLINKQVGELVIMNDLELPMLSYYVIYYEKFKKVMWQTEKEALGMFVLYILNLLKCVLILWAILNIVVAKLKLVLQNENWW